MKWKLERPRRVVWLAGSIRMNSDIAGQPARIHLPHVAPGCAAAGYLCLALAAILRFCRSIRSASRSGSVRLAVVPLGRHERGIPKWTSSVRLGAGLSLRPAHGQPERDLAGAPLAIAPGFSGTCALVWLAFHIHGGLRNTRRHNL